MITEVKQEFSETMFHKENDYLPFEDMYPTMEPIASKPEPNGFWNDNALNERGPMTPVTPTLYAPDAPISAKSQPEPPKSSEFQQYLSPEEMLLADDMDLFDDQTYPPISSWEPLFLNDSITCPEDAKGYAAIEVKPQQQPEPQVQRPEPAVERVTSPQSDYTPSPNMHSSMSPSLSDSSHYEDSPAMSVIGSPSSIVKSTTASPRTREIKLDDLGITAYKRKPRTTPLKPVEVPMDATGVVAKRAKNTEAARRSRARKLERMSQLEERVRALLEENEALRAEIAQLKG